MGSNYASRMPDAGDERRSLWSFPSGLIGPHDSVKGYAAGESYLVVTSWRHLRETHHVVPAGAVQTVDVSQRKVCLRMTRADVERSPEHHDPAAPLDGATVDFLAGLWPTWLDGSGQ